MARRQQNSPISLFPFLAVLVCTMGALILLLLVTTRQIRHEQRAVQTPLLSKAQERELDSPGSPASVSAASEIDDNSVPDALNASPATALSDTEPEAVLKPQRNYQAEIASLNEQIAAGAELLMEKQQHTAALEDETSQGQQQLKQLESEAAATTAELQSLQAAQQNSELPQLMQKAADLAEQQQLLQTRMDEATRRLQQKQQELKSLNVQTEAVEKQLDEQRSALVSLRKQIQLQQEQAKTSNGQKTLLAFSNSTGTSRTPIVIDVSDAGYEFLPTGVRITAQDMQGFPVRDNPLLSGVLTLHRHRSSGSVTSQPYVLLLVRPNGSLPFYGAQRVFTEAGVHFGYELVEQDREFTFGKRDDAEVRIVREALLEALNRRQRTYAMLQQAAELPTGSAGSDSGQRRMVVRSDGRVMTADEADRRPLEGKFYAGGEAPPTALPPRIRPPATVRRPNTVDEPLWASERTSETPPGSDQPQQKPGNSAEGFVTFESWLSEQKHNPLAAANAPGKQSTLLADGNGTLKAAEQSGQNDGGPQGTDPQSASPQGGSLSSRNLPGGVQPEESQALTDTASTSSDSDSTGTHRSTSAQNSGTASAEQLMDGQLPSGTPSLTASSTTPQSAGMPMLPMDNLSSGKPVDLTMIDPELMRLLKSEAARQRELSTPVGITVFLDAEYMTIGQQPAVFVTPDTLGHALTQLLRGISDEVAANRRDPKEPLLPIIKFVVSPGGEQLRIPLARELRKIGIPSASVIEIAPYVVPADDAGRTTISDTLEYSAQTGRTIR